MSNQSNLADLLTRLRNAVAVGHKSVEVVKTSLVERFLAVLREEGFIENFEEINKRVGKTERSFLKVNIKFFRQRPVINELKLISKPSKRVYVGVNQIPLFKRGLGISVLSTNQGIMSDRKARQLGIGGELLAEVS